MNFRKVLFWGYIAILFPGLLFMLPAAAREKGIPIQPITPGTSELLSNLQVETKKLMTKADASASDLKKIYKQIDKIGCAQSQKEDCTKMYREMRRKYVKYLDAINTSLPAFEAHFSKTLNAFEKNLKNFRRKTSVKELWEQISGKTVKNIAIRPARRGLRMVRILSSFYRTLTMASRSGAHINQYTTLYEDLKNAEPILKLIRQEIQTQKVYASIPAQFSEVNFEKDREIFKKIQSEIFGEEDDGPIISEPSEKEPTTPGKPDWSNRP